MSWGRPQILLFYFNFGALLHLQYIKFLIEAFLQSCRYGKYLSFSTLSWGLSNLHYPATILAELQLKKLWAWAEAKTGLCWGRIKEKVSDDFQTFWIFNKFICSNSIPSFMLATGIMGLNMKMWTCWRSKMFETIKIF